MLSIKTTNTILYCEKWQECVAFYKTQLGLSVTTENDWFVEFKLTESSRLSVANTAKTSIKSSKGEGITITFKVDDIEMIYQNLQKAKLKPTPIKDHHWGAKVIYIYDPEGNRLEFWSPLLQNQERMR